MPTSFAVANARVFRGIDADTVGTVATAMETFEKHGFMADLAKQFMTEVLQPTASEGIKSRRDEAKAGFETTLLMSKPEFLKGGTPESTQRASAPGP